MRKEFMGFVIEVGVRFYECSTNNAVEERRKFYFG